MNIVNGELKELCYSEKQLKSFIHVTLSDYQPQTHLFSKKTSVPAAVLIPLFFKDGQAHLLFTKRTETVAHHKGQISFPGGRFDDTDSSLEFTALRETEEEVGIHQNQVEILGRTDRFLTNTYFLVSPYVGFFSYPYPYVVSEAEIDRIIEVPLLHLLQPEIFETKPIKKDGQSWMVHYYHYQSDVIWGVTGFLLSNFLSILFDHNHSDPY